VTCYYCGKTAQYICDAIVYGNTCHRHLCTDHAVPGLENGDVSAWTLCPVHAYMQAKSTSNNTSAVTTVVTTSSTSPAPAPAPAQSLNNVVNDEIKTNLSEITLPTRPIDRTPKHVFHDYTAEDCRTRGMFNIPPLLTSDYPNFDDNYNHSFSLYKDRSIFPPARATNDAADQALTVPYNCGYNSDYKP
jgi:hypothetical protein